MLRTLLVRCCLIAALTTLCVGCPNKTNGLKETPPPSVSAESAAGETGADEVAKALEELSPEDRAAATAQKTCPVSGEPLGSMGKPLKVQVQNRDVFVCCESCIEPLKKEPEKYLAKLAP